MCTGPGDLEPGVIGERGCVRFVTDVADLVRPGEPASVECGELDNVCA